MVRVHPENLDRQQLPGGAKGKGVWNRRYREINDWERYLTDNGFKVVKLFLNLSKEEQRTRFFKRLDLPEKNWKFSASDVRERQRWDDYQQAFSEMLSATSTSWAPWYVIPADRKWFARICTAAVLAHTLIGIDPQYPEVTAERRADLLMVKGELEPRRPRRPRAPTPTRSQPRRPRKKPRRPRRPRKPRKPRPRQSPKKAEPKKAEAKKAAAYRVAGNGSRLPGAAVRGERGSAGPEPVQQRAEVDGGDPH